MAALKQCDLQLFLALMTIAAPPQLRDQIRALGNWHVLYIMMAAVS